MHNISFVPNSL